MKGLIGMNKNQDSLAYLITAEQLGISEAAPGTSLMNVLIHALTQHSIVPSSILLVNTAVRLVTEYSEALEDMKALSERGCDIVSCGTCVNFYGLTDKFRVGRMTNMLEITEILSAATRTVTL